MSKNHFTGEEILKKYGLVDLDLFNAASSGELQPLDEYGKPLPDPVLAIMDAEIDRWTVRVETIKEYVPGRVSVGLTGWINYRTLKLVEPKKTLEGLEMFRAGYIKSKAGAATWKGYKLQDDPDKASRQFSTLRKALFDKDEVERVLGKLPSDLDNKNYLFSCSGKQWKIRYLEDTKLEKIEIDNTDGLQYIAKVLEHSRHYFACTELRDQLKGIAKTSPKLPGANYMFENQETTYINKDGANQDSADQKTIEKVFRKVWEQLNSQDAPDAPDARVKTRERWEELNKIYKDELAVSVKDGKPNFRWKKSRDTDRVNVTKRINEAIENIKKEGAPRLASHLKLRIGLGKTIVYQPRKGFPDWFVEY